MSKWSAKRLDFISAGTRLKYLVSSHKPCLPRSLKLKTEQFFSPFPSQKKPECFIKTRSNETLSECIRPFTFSKGERYARLLQQQLHLSVQTDQLNSKERISTSLPYFPTNSLWIRAKLSFSLLLLVLSAVSTCCTEYIVGFNNIFINASKSIV